MTANDLEKALSAISKSRVKYQPFYRYFNGEHELNFASEKFRNKFGKRVQKLTDNLCKVVVNAPVSRLEVIDFAKENAEVGSEAWALWKRSKMPRISKSVHREAFKTGDAYVIVWLDRAGRARFDFQKASSVRVWYDEETGEISRGAKIWTEQADGKGSVYYLTLYYPDRIEKYVSKNKLTLFPTKANQFEPRDVDGENFPLENPFGRVPVFHFSATESESLLGDVIPLQDALNKTLADIMVGAEFNSIRQRWATGIQFEVDEMTGKPVIPFEYDDSIWEASEPEGKFGEFSDLALEPYLKTASEFRQEIARVTGIPAHYFNLGTGDFPSGEALRTAEARFIALIEDAQLAFGETWAQAMDFALRLESSVDLVLGDNADEPFEVRWRDAAPSSLTEQLSDALLKRELGISLEQILGDLGYTEKQIADFARAKETEVDELGDVLGRAFDAGRTDFSG